MSTNQENPARFTLGISPEISNHFDLRDRQTPVRCLSTARLSGRKINRALGIILEATARGRDQGDSSIEAGKDDIHLGLISACEALKSVLNSIGPAGQYACPTQEICLVQDLSAEVEAYLLAVCMIDMENLPPFEEGDKK